jgi:hypothetical protein
MEATMQDTVRYPSRDARRLIGRLLPVVIVAATACADTASPTDVSPVGEPLQQAAIDATAALSSIDDALARIVPALNDRTNAAPLRAALLELRIVLAAGGGAGSTTTEAAARAVDAYRRNSIGEVADLDAIRLALDVAAGSRRSDAPTH